ncbi:MAG: helix-hairpin-helix domain-containing protein [Candidatus Natronoplasma sp.]
MQENNASKEESLKDLTSIPSIGNLTALALIDSNYDSISKLKDADTEDLTSIDHIGENLANKIIEEIKEGSFDEKEEEKNTTLEFRCPVCERFTGLEDDECQECEEPVEIFSSVVLPDRGIIENPKETLAKVEEKILDNGGDAENWFIRGSIMECMGANRKALESFDRVIELDPLFDYVWNAKAQVSLKIGKTEEAAKAYKLAFNAQKGQANLMGHLESAEKSTPKEITKPIENDELDKELDSKLSKARELLGELDDGERDISEISAVLDDATEERIEGNRDKALEMVEDAIKRCQSLSDMEDERVEELSERIQKVDEFSEELSEEIRKITGIVEATSQAKEALEKREPGKVSGLLSRYLENEPSLRYISENLNKMKALKDQIKELGVKEDFLDDIDKDFEKVEELCRNEEYQKAEDLFEDLMEQLEGTLEYVERIRDEYLNEIEETIERGEKKGFDLETVKNDLGELKEKFKAGAEDRKDMIERFEAVKQKAEKTLSLRSNISEIEEMLSKNQEELNISEYEERIEEIEDVFEEGNFEKAIDSSGELKENLKTDVKELEEGDKEELENKAEAKLAEARKKLSELRETDFNIEHTKGLLKDSNDCRKRGDLQKSIALTEKFIDSADKMIKLSKLIKKAHKKIEELESKNLVDKETMEYELDQYKKLVMIEKYGLAQEFLSETVEELEEAIDKEKKIPTPEEKLDKSDTQIPTQIKEKVRNVKELNNLVEKAEIEIQVNRKPLKEAIIKIKDLEYVEANKILMDWKESLIDRLDYELENRLEMLHEILDNLDIPSVQRRGKAILGNVERKWDIKAYEEALNSLIYASDFIHEIQDVETKKDKQIFLSSELLEDISLAGGSTKEIEALLSKARENIEKEEVFEKALEEIKKKIEGYLEDKMDEDIEMLDDSLKGITRKKVIAAISNLIDVKSSLDEGEVEKASWHMREYMKAIE